MNNYTWFKLLVRAVGILLIGLSISSVVMTAGWLVQSFKQSPAAFGSFDQLIYAVISVVANSAQLLFGAYLLFGGEWIIRICLRDLDGRCAACGYDLAGVTGGVCPECGVQRERPAAP